jgi:hypothetical protein
MAFATGACLWCPIPELPGGMRDPGWELVENMMFLEFNLCCMLGSVVHLRGRKGCDESEPWERDIASPHQGGEGGGA